ncbi:hypothetical protein GCM10010250_21410 [Streptomyces althioticus]|uniref:hypothetical protein n=1 Tax=Streptomyces althioticus TaxID=83380 RepID=UPI001873F9A7|nr:hypothetical protein GCM10010250_21410 [Streptomyces althioticus]
MMTSQEAAQLIHDALAAAMSGDGDRTAEIVARLGIDSDTSRMYGVWNAIAQAGHRALRHTFGDRAPNPLHGDYWKIEQLEPGALDDPVQATAMRFLVAVCNGDTDMARAHYEAALRGGPELFVHSTCQLLVDVAGLCIAATDQPAADG